MFKYASSSAASTATLAHFHAFVCVLACMQLIIISVTCIIGREPVRYTASTQLDSVKALVHRPRLLGEHYLTQHEPEIGFYTRFKSLRSYQADIGILFESPH